ncbi:MAG: fluoride efflux transporter CrcB [Nocardioidaceae bacterium]
MTAVLLVGVGAAVGAPLRYLADRMVQSRHDSVFPWGTFTVNVVASVLLGAITAASVHGGVSIPVVALVGPGFCGALSTYSTYSYETFRLVEEGSWFLAGCNVVVSVAAGLGGAALGWRIGLTLR